MGKRKRINIFEMIHSRAKGSEIWVSREPLKHVWVIFDLTAFKVIWGHLVHLRLSGNEIFKTLLILHL